jgi:hypothetical protein
MFRARRAGRPRANDAECGHRSVLDAAPPRIRAGEAQSATRTYHGTRDGGRNGQREWDVDFESASVAGEADLDLFVRDLALCLSVHRDRSPALVWPDGIDAVTAAVRGEPARSTEPGPDGMEGPDGPEVVVSETLELTTALGDLLGCEVVSSFIVLPKGAQRADNAAKTDLVLVPVRGSCGGRVEPFSPAHGRTVLDHALELRLRVGEALYVPRGFLYTLNDVHTPCTLQVLALQPPAW